MAETNSQQANWLAHSEITGLGFDFRENAVEKIKKVMKIAKEPVSLETPIGEDEDSSRSAFG